MSNLEFKQQLHEYSQWRSHLLQAIEMYLEWRQRYHLNDTQSTHTILNLLHGLKSDRITLAFVAEFSRGKTELINALFLRKPDLDCSPPHLDARPCVLPNCIMIQKVVISGY